MKEAIHYLEYIKSRGVKSVSKTKPVTKPVVENSGAKVSAKTVTTIQTEIKPLMDGFLSFDAGKEKFASLDEVKTFIGDCKKCRLCELRKNIVVGEGNPNAKLMFVGEGPGEDEDNSGRPFVGRAGQLLTKIIEAMKLTRDDVYIANIVKCRPPNNRAPSEDEVIGCAPYLMKQISVLKPKVIVTLGEIGRAHV